MNTSTHCAGVHIERSEVVVMKCAYCGKDVKELVKHVDATQTEYSICKECEQKVNEYKCIKCGEMVDPALEIEGLCGKCLQVKMKRRTRSREAVLMDLGPEHIGDTMSEAEFEKWMTFNPEGFFTPSKMGTDMQCRMLWIGLKLMVAGVDPEEQSKYVPDVENILDTYFSELVGKPCKLIVAKDSGTRAEVRQHEIIGSSGACYLVKR